MQQSVIDTKNRAKESARRFWQTSIPQNAYEDMLSKGQIPSNTAAVGHKPQGKLEPAPAPAYSWRGRTWSDQAGHLQRGKRHSLLLLQSFSDTQDQILRIDLSNSLRPLMTFMYASLHRLKPIGLSSLANKFNYTS